LIVGIECDSAVGELVAAARERGLLVVTAGPQVIRLLPNLRVDRAEIDQAVDILVGLLAEQTVTTRGSKA
jgi:acetylornithine aminotransferase